MQSLNISTSTPGSFSLDGSLTAANLIRPWPDRKAQWQKCDKEIVLDLANVSAIDTAGLAWLIQLLDECQQANKSLKIVNIPDSLTKLAKMSDAEGLLPLQ